MGIENNNIGGYGASVGAVGEMNDPRLKDIIKAKHEEVARTQKNLPSPAGIPRPPMKPGQGQPQTQKTQGYDDASPTGGADWSGEDNAPVTAQTTPQPFSNNKKLATKETNPCANPGTRGRETVRFI
ncbi:hypothetical protein EYC84_009942 [Monilinia fructicola]|uniref:Uncharacterized protein n=1 Tax=Monilinia fructicola TaxID=38448 RepID=A0A5M9JEV2_MONFR|nr:hypothetical protein EYC84_009942 [Monilinia fructicola]